MKMEIGLKLFPGSLVALLLGIILVVPLIYTSTVIAPEATAAPMFDVDLQYAYIERQNSSTVPSSDNINETITQDIPAVSYKIGLNYTRASEQVDICDLKSECYRIEIYSDKEPIGNLMMNEGIVYNQSIIGQPSAYFSDFASNPFFDGCSSGGGSIASADWSNDESRVGFCGGGGTKWADSVNEAETIFVRVTRVGWLIKTGNSTEVVVLSEPYVIAEVQLEKYGDGFLYNNLLTEEEVSHLINPLYPYGKIFDDPCSP